MQLKLLDLKSWILSLNHRIWLYIKHNPIPTLIGSIVFFCHLFLVLYPYPSKNSFKPLKKQVIVTTYSLPPPPALKTTPIHAKQGNFSAGVKKPLSSPKKVSSSTNLSHRKKILKELEKTIGKIEASHDKNRDEFAPILPKAIDKLHIDYFPPEVPNETINTLEGDVVGMIAQFKTMLELPEYGVVKLELTLSDSGLVKNLRILSTESEKNQKYLESHLPKIQFPTFLYELKGKPEHTFTFTFCNEK